MRIKEFVIMSNESLTIILTGKLDVLVVRVCVDVIATT